jgi:uncharacterized protein YlaI
MKPIAHFHGQVLARWYAFCSLCPQIEQLKQSHTTSFTAAKRYFRSQGWKEGHRRLSEEGDPIRLWLCPNCAKKPSTRRPSRS